MWMERGRLASMVRYTENVGFDGVYYGYNAMNKVVSVHVIDPSKQHATWYTYDASGRVSSMATRSNDAGYGNGAGSPGPNAVHNIPTMPVLLWKSDPYGCNTRRILHAGEVRRWGTRLS